MDPEICKRYFYADTKKIYENENILRLRNWIILKSDYPVFVISMRHPASNKQYAFSFLYDDIPISMTVVDPETFSPVPHSEWPQGNYFLNDHTISHGPFLCAPGIRQYHTHSSHSGESQWLFTSPEFRLPPVLDSVYSHLLRAAS